MTAFTFQFSFCVLCLAVVLTGCSKREKNSPKSAVAKPVEACSLLTSDEIKSVQGEAVVSTKASGNTGPEFTVSQCYFSTAIPVNSVVVTVTQKGIGGEGRSLKELWKETFGDDKESEKAREKKRNNEEEHEGPKPERIEGLGDEAFWTGNRFGGALYMLKDEFHIRISIGGADDPATKKRKCKTLAEMILKRL